MSGGLSSSAVSIMAREMQVRYGPVPDALNGLPVLPGNYRITSTEFLLREPEFSIYYRPGDGVVIDNRAGDSRDIELFLQGSTYAAVACINGLFPIHASGVAIGERVFAFTGPPGAGKSTLALGLTQRGLPLFCDDTLIVDLSDPARLVALPGHKRLKLWPDSLEILGMAPGELVSPEYPKHYATPAGGDVPHPLPLAGLIHLQEGDLEWLELRGSDRLRAMDDDHYTRQFYDSVNRHDLRAGFAVHARIASQLPMYRFSRPLKRSLFASSTDYLYRRLMELAEQ